MFISVKYVEESLVSDPFRRKCIGTVCFVNILQNGFWQFIFFVSLTFEHETLESERTKTRLWEKEEQICAKR